LFPFSPLRVSWVPSSNLDCMLWTWTPVGLFTGFKLPRYSVLPSRWNLRSFVPYSLGTHTLNMTRLDTFTCVTACNLSVYASPWLFNGGTRFLPVCKTRYRALVTDYPGVARQNPPDVHTGSMRLSAPAHISTRLQCKYKIVNTLKSQFFKKTRYIFFNRRDVPSNNKKYLYLLISYHA
jgi:hypothetical protein